jgi:PBP1b-binding outer membrane lipoprotein LpoB
MFKITSLRSSSLAIAGSFLVVSVLLQSCSPAPQESEKAAPAKAANKKLNLHVASPD